MAVNQAKRQFAWYNKDVGSALKLSALIASLFGLVVIIVLLMATTIGSIVIVHRGNPQECAGILTEGVFYFSVWTIDFDDPQASKLYSHYTRISRSLFVMQTHGDVTVSDSEFWISLWWPIPVLGVPSRTRIDSVAPEAMEAA